MRLGFKVKKKKNKKTKNIQLLISNNKKGIRGDNNKVLYNKRKIKSSFKKEEGKT